MAKGNTFKSHVNEILVDEAVGDVLNKVQKVAHQITGSDLFQGPGFATNSYDPKKNYYPNIRTSFLGIRNTKLDTASQGIIDTAKKLKMSGTSLKDPTTPVPNELKSYVSEKFSINYVQGSIDQFEKNIIEIREGLAKMQSARNPALIKMLASLKIFDTAKPTGKTGRNAFVYNQLYTNLEKFLNEVTNPAFGVFASMSLSQRSHFINILSDFKNKLQDWKILMKTTQGAVSAPVDTVPPIGLFLNSDGLIYRNLWDTFLDVVQNAVIGAGQRGWTEGANIISIVKGEAPGTYKKRGEIKFTDDNENTIDPRILKTFHEKTMLPLFVTGQNKVLIYTTSEQWESITQGGRGHKALTGLAKQAYTAGQNAPKVKL